jgi:hypothetical protein
MTFAEHLVFPLSGLNGHFLISLIYLQSQVVFPADAAAQRNGVKRKPILDKIDFNRQIV